jgi:hypothetical protein
MQRPSPLLLYLLNCSKTSMSEFFRKQLNDSANLRKEINRTLPIWIEAQASAIVTEWFMQNGEALMALASASTPAEREAILEELTKAASDEHAKAVNQGVAETPAFFRPPSRVQRYVGGFRKRA